MDKKTLNCIGIAIGERYFKKHTKSLTQKDIALYQKPIQKAITKFAQTNKRFFQSAALDKDDLYSVSLVHLTSYLSLLALESNEAQMKAFETAVKSKKGDNYIVTQADIDDKNIANFVFFLKQRLSELSKKLGSRSALSMGAKKERVHFVSNNPISSDDIERFVTEGIGSLKQVSQKESLIMKKEGKQISSHSYALSDGGYLRTYNKISYNSHSDILDATHGNSDYRPDIIIEKTEEEVMDLEFKERFCKMEKNKRRGILTRFIANNQDKVEMKDSVILAKKIMLGRSSL